MAKKLSHFAKFGAGSSSSSESNVNVRNSTAPVSKKDGDDYLADVSSLTIVAKNKKAGRRRTRGKDVSSYSSSDGIKPKHQAHPGVSSEQHWVEDDDDDSDNSDSESRKLFLSLPAQQRIKDHHSQDQKHVATAGSSGKHGSTRKVHARNTESYGSQNAGGLPKRTRRTGVKGRDSSSSTFSSSLESEPYSGTDLTKPQIPRHRSFDSDFQDTDISNEIKAVFGGNPRLDFELGTVQKRKPQRADELEDDVTKAIEEVFGTPISLTYACVQPPKTPDIKQTKPTENPPHLPKEGRDKYSHTKPDDTDNHLEHAKRDWEFKESPPDHAKTRPDHAKTHPDHAKTHPDHAQANLDQYFMPSTSKFSSSDDTTLSGFMSLGSTEISSQASVAAFSSPIIGESRPFIYPGALRFPLLSKTVIMSPLMAPQSADPASMIANFNSSSNEAVETQAEEKSTPRSLFSCCCSSRAKVEPEDEAKDTNSEEDIAAKILKSDVTGEKIYF